MIFRCILSASVLTLISTPGLAQSRTQNGATVGGVAGAVIGGIIGHQNDETPEGALIGGAVGAITGGLIGRAQDNDLARQRAYQEQAYYQQQQQYYAQQQVVANSGVSINDVVNMARSNISESVIMSHIQSKGVQRRLEVPDIIALHQAGASDTLITVMQQAPLATQLTSPAPPPSVVVQQPNVIVHEQPVIYRSPVVVERYYRPYPVHRHYYHGHHGGLHFGF